VSGEDFPSSSAATSLGRIYCILQSIAFIGNDTVVLFPSAEATAVIHFITSNNSYSSTISVLINFNCRNSAVSSNLETIIRKLIIKYDTE